MALLKGLDGVRFEMKPVGYQFPGVPRDEAYGFDVNWLMIRISAFDGTRSWGATDPALLTWEARDLIDWLMGYCRGASGIAAHCSFTEPNLFFEIVAQGLRRLLKLTLSGEFRPPGSKEPDEEVTLVFPAREDNLEAFARDFEVELRAFPVLDEKGGVSVKNLRRARSACLFRDGKKPAAFLEQLPFDLIVIDLETNGLDLPDTRIIEIGAVRLDREFDLDDLFSELVDGRPFVRKSGPRNAVTEAMLEGQATWKDVAPRFAKWCEKLDRRYVLASWGTHFDIPLLRSEYVRVGMKYPHPGQAFDVKSICWLELIRRGKAPRTAGLGAVCRALSMPFEGTPHRAGPNAWMAAKVLRRLVGPAPKSIKLISPYWIRYPGETAYEGEGTNHA